MSFTVALVHFLSERLQEGTVVCSHVAGSRNNAGVRHSFVLRHGLDEEVGASEGELQGIHPAFTWSRRSGI